MKSFLIQIVRFSSFPSLPSGAFFFFLAVRGRLGCAGSMWKFPGQGSNPGHSSDPSDCSDNAQYPTPCNQENSWSFYKTCARARTHTHTHTHTRTHAHSIAPGAFLSLSPCLTIFQSPVCGGGEGVCPSLTFSFPSSNSHPSVPQQCLKALEENCNSIVILYSHCYIVFRLML